MAMINCSNCGNAYDDSNAFCLFCGAKTEKAAQAPSEQQAPPAQQPFYPQQPYYYAPAENGKQGVGFGWIVFMRVILWISFCLIALGSLVGGIILISEANRWHEELLWIGLAVIFGGVLTAFILVASGMIALNNASNLNKIATNSARILDRLERK